jgi:hypothetical protein
MIWSVIVNSSEILPRAERIVKWRHAVLQKKRAIVAKNWKHVKPKRLNWPPRLLLTSFADRGETERVWASVLKEVVKRRNPGFNESYFGFRTFGNLLEEAANRGLLGFGRDEKSGAYVTRAQVRMART